MVEASEKITIDLQSGSNSAPVSSEPNYTKAVKAAQLVLSENYVLAEPVNVRDIAKNYGLEVVDADFGEKLSNVAGFINPENRTIYLNSGNPENRKTFTIAHELGHWILHRDKLEKEPEKYAVLYRIPLGRLNQDPVESEANCFAANLLVPKTYLEKHIEKYSDVDQLANIFNVSTEVIGFRLKYESRHSGN